MKIAVFHNFLDNIGGAEIVTLTLARGLNADVYTTNIDSEKIIQMGFKDVLPRIHSIGKVPIQAPFRHQLAFLRFRLLNLNGLYDFFIISGDWAMSGAVRNHPNMWYVHSPLNELWQFKDYVRNEILPWWQRPFYDVWVFINRFFSRRYSRYVDTWVCNSKNTQNRLRRFYHVTNATVISPPVTTAAYSSDVSRDYWLSVNRLFKHKRVDIQLKAFSLLPHERLIIVGSYEKGVRHWDAYQNYMRQLCPSNVQILSWVDDITLKKLYSECRGFITTSQDEDFGMSAVEAMAAGKPVIAPNEGGYRESVINGKTGILLDQMTPKNLKQAVEEVNSILESSPLFYKNSSQAQAGLFDVAVFISQIKNLIT